jgi:CelD/BcsL family acetyltransferase involved in cellulose biosynthesis
MVDAGAIGASGEKAKTAQAADAGGIAAAVFKGNAAIDAYGAAASAGAVAAPAQSEGWVRAWIQAVPSDAIVAVASENGLASLSLALEVVQWGPWRVARFLGGRHANGNFPLLSRKKGTPARNRVDALLAAIRDARPDLDMLCFERLLPEMEGYRNPLLALAHRPSPNLSLASNLDGGFEALLKRQSGKRKRKRYRSQQRQFEEAGGARRIQASSRAQTDSMLEAFFAMKEVRFRELGIPDAFAGTETKSFFRQLFAEALSEEPPPFVLHGLEVGGKLRAVTGSSRRGDSLVCEFGAFAEDELAGAGPGSFLFFENIQEAAAQGFRLYDFSVGDEPYKRQWCELEITHFDAFVPLTVKGRLLAMWISVLTRMTTFVKRTPVLWTQVKRLRRKTAGS